MDFNILEKLGLSKAEIKVYISLLQLGSVPSGKIAHETNLRRSTVYDSIRRLEQKGMISHILKSSVKYFEAVPVDRILDYFQEQKREMQETEKNVLQLISDLKKGFDILKPKAEAHILEGIEGFKTMRRDVLKHANGELMLIGAISLEDEIMPAFFKDWNKYRQKKKINWRVLHKEKVRTKVLAKLPQLGTLCETKFLPDQIENPAVINIYSDRVVNVLWKNKQPVCFMLINKEIAESYKQYFEFLWKQAKD